MIMELRDSSRPLERVGILNLPTIRIEEVGEALEKDPRCLEGGHVVKDFWQDEIEERPKLRQVVLQNEYV